MVKDTSPEGSGAGRSGHRLRRTVLSHVEGVCDYGYVPFPDA